MHRKSRNITLRNVLFSYIAVFMIPTLLLTFFVQVSIINAILDQEINSIEDELAYNRLLMDAQLSRFSDIANTVYFDYEISDAISDSTDLPSNYRKFTALQQNIRKYVFADSLLEDLVLYIPGSDCMVSAQSSYLLEHYLKMFRVEGVETKAELYGILNGGQQRILHIARINTGEKYAVFFMPLQSTYTRVLPALLFVTSENGYTSFLKKAVGDYAGAALVCDGSGVISHYASDPAFTPDMCTALLSSYDFAAGGILRSGNYIIAGLPSESVGLRYAVIIDQRSVEARTTYIRFLWYGIVAICLLLGLATAIIVGRRSYKPIGRLRAQASTLFDSNDADDYAYLSDALEFMDTQNVLLKNSLDDINDYLVFRLLRGVLGGPDEIASICGILGVEPYSALFRVLIVKQDGAVSARDVCSELMRVLPESVHILMRRSAEENAVILAYNKSLSFPDDLTPLHLRYSYVSGSIQPDIRRIPLSYAEAAVGTVGTPEYAARCAALEDAAQVRDMERFEACLADLTAAISDGTMTPEDAKLSAVRYTLMLNDAARANHTQGSVIDLPDCYTVLQYPDREAVLAFFLQYDAAFVRKLVLPDVEVGENLNSRMIAYLKYHCSDANFTFQQMAGDFQLTLPVLSRQFLDANGKTLSDYMTDLRIETAKRLLTTTALSINEIAMEVGYYNANSFIRRFKQVTDLTPGRYRQQYGKE